MQREKAGTLEMMGVESERGKDGAKVRNAFDDRTTSRDARQKTSTLSGRASR